MSPWRLDGRFDIPENAPILRFLRSRSPSAHSDVADELIRSAATLPGVSHYCPDPASYAFVLLHRPDSTIIGLAFGQSGLAFRLPGHRTAEALLEGGALVPDLGPDWVRFVPWPNEKTLVASRRRLSRWCRIAAG